MRSTTKTIVGLASLGVLAASYKFGIEAPAAFANQDALTSLGSNTSQTTDTNNTDAGTGTSDTTTSGNGSTTDNSGNTTSGSTGSSGGSTGSAGSGSSSGSSGSGSGSTSGGSSTGGSTSGSSSSGSTSGGTTDPGTSGGSTSGGSTSGGSTSGSASVTKTGDAIRYRYGTIQVQVTEVSGKITDITLLQAGATGGRSAAFSYLIDYAIQAQGSNFGNISGATYTTDAFVQSLDSALAQF
ncbi:MAG: hypothetical protein RL009_618 [Actinomycetota bacterium]